MQHTTITNALQNQQSSSCASDTLKIQTKANSLEESIIQTLHEKYKDFTVDDGDEETSRVPVGDWEATKWRSPRRSQSWLCCPTIYNRDEVPATANMAAQSFKDEAQNSSITVAPKLNNPLQLQAHTSSTMRGELVELTHRLQRAEHGRHVVEQQLRETLMDRDRIHRQLESLAANSESRITEMHCVIVELSKKLKTKEDGAIAEEPEGSGECKFIYYLFLHISTITR